MMQIKSKQMSSTSFTEKFLILETLYTQQQKQTLLVADKKFDVDYVQDQSLEKLVKMIKKSSQISQQNLVNYQNSLIESQHIYCVFEQQVSNFKHILESLFPFGIQSWSLLKIILRSVISGLKYLHDNRIVHRNISSERLFVNEDGTIKLDYFGHFILQGSDEQSNCQIYGNLSYVAPELLKENSLGYTTQSDIYAFGALCYELMTGQKIFQNLKIHEAIQQIFSKDIQFTRNILKAFPQKLIKLVKSCMSKNPNERPTIQMVERILGKLDSKTKNRKIIKEKIVDRYNNVTQKTNLYTKENTFQLIQKNL